MEPSKDRKIVPDMPEMRSVRIGAPIAMPQRSLLRSMPTTTKAPLAQIRQAPVTPASEATWTPRNIPPLPQMYPLERSHVYVDDDQKHVASRIANVLRQQSLAPVFEDEKVRIWRTSMLLYFVGFLTWCDLQASAETVCHVRLVVRMFSEGEKVVVEVQRRSGCCFVFHQVAKAILKAAKGEPAKKVPKFTVPASVIKEEQQRSSCNEALEIANELLQKDRIDAQALGMSSLVQLTNEGSSRFAASAILEGPLLDAVLKFVQPTESVDEVLEEHRTEMRGDAFRVLANCLASTTAKLDIEKLGSDEILEALIKELRVAEEKPHNAWHACKVLKALLKDSEALRTKAEQLGAPSAVTVAYNEGVCRHAMLEKEATALKSEMANCM